jgi:uncharacterized membrane protein
MLGIIIASGTLLVSVWLVPPTERFAVIAILNESFQAGPYPTSVTQNTVITLNVEVHNFMGTVQYFYVKVKLANETTMTTSDYFSSASMLEQHERILGQGQTWAFPVHINMTTTGINFRLTFELWRYDPVSDAIIWVRNSQGDGVWVHLPMNVTTS